MNVILIIQNIDLNPTCFNLSKSDRTTTHKSWKCLLSREKREFFSVVEAYNFISESNYIEININFPNFCSFTNDGESWDPGGILTEDGELWKVLTLQHSLEFVY